MLIDSRIWKDINMGADIHCVLCVKNPNTQIFEKVSDEFGPYHSHWLRQLSLPENERNHYWKRKGWTIPRHYSLFGVLAGVRNRYVPMILEPRGIPENINQDAKNHIEDWGDDGHTHSYYMLDELLKAKNQTFIQEIYLHIDDYKSFKNKDYDNLNYYYDLPYGDYKEISLKEMDRYHELSVYQNDNSYDKMLAKTTIELPYKSICPYFWNEFLDAANKLDANPKNIMFLFWFDN